MKKGKVLATLSMLVLTIACLTFGVFAIISTSFSANGTITFNAYELDILVHGEILGAVDNGSLVTDYKKATKDAHGVSGYTTSGNGTLPAWSMGGLGFDELNENNLIIIKFTITNYSKYAIEATATIANQSTLETNLTIQNVPMYYCYDAVYDGSGNLVNTNRGELILTFAPNAESAAFSNDLSISIDITPSSKTPTTEGFTTSVSGDEVTITGYTGSDTEVIIPRTIDDKTVTNIGNSAFESGGMESLVISDTVTSIGTSAFYRSGIISVTIPNSVTSIGESAFDSCYNISSVILSNSITTIENSVFSGCFFATITIPSSIISIGDWAFSGCTELTTIMIPNSVQNMGTGVFGDCTRLSSITVEGGNATYDSRDNCNAIIETSSDTLIAGCKNTVIPDSVTSIGDSAFSNCSKLTTITIPSSIISIGVWAFSGCAELTTIMIPNSVQNMGTGCFQSSSLTSVIIEDGVTSIGDSAFAYCSKLTTITIPNSVTSIGKNAFYLCSALDSAEFENATGWKVGDSLATCNTAVTISTTDYSANATSLKSTHASKYWKRG